MTDSEPQADVVSDAIAELNSGYKSGSSLAEKEMQDVAIRDADYDVVRDDMCCTLAVKSWNSSPAGDTGYADRRFRVTRQELLEIGEASKQYGGIVLLGARELQKKLDEARAARLQPLKDMAYNPATQAPVAPLKPLRLKLQ